MLADPEHKTMSLEEIVAEEIQQFRASEQYRNILDGERYYRNRSAVQQKSNEVASRSNTKIEHPLIKKLVDQKADYLLSRPFTIKTGDKDYAKQLNKLFGPAMRRKIKSFGKNAVKCGIAWLQPYFQEGRLEFMLVPAWELVPLWSNSEKNQLDGFIRFYLQEVYEGRQRKEQVLAEYWSEAGVQRFHSLAKNSGMGFSGKLELFLTKNQGNSENNYTEPHFILDGKPMNFEQIPLVWLRYNEEELPLAYYIKELVDDINWQTSVTADALRDIAKFIFVLRNYGGQDLGEFVKDLQEHLAIKVDADGGVEKLQAELNIDAAMAFLDKNRRDAIYFASGVDTRDPQLGTASGTAIAFRYMDLDNDCQALGLEMQQAFSQIKFFADLYLQAAGLGSYFDESMEVLFNMDLPVNEGDIIRNVMQSAGLLSLETRLENHPWVRDVQQELERLQLENPPEPPVAEAFV